MIIRNMPFQEYLAHPAVNNSLLKLLAKAPELAKAYLDGEYKVEPTAAMRLGTLVHTLVLEPEDFGIRYAIEPECDRRTKAGKEEFERFSSRLNGREVITITHADWEIAAAMRAAVLEHQSARLLLEDSESEVSMFAELDGIECKCRIDVRRDDGIICDLKTTSDASPSGFARSAANLDYLVAAALYTDISQALGIDVSDYVWIAVESKPPHLVAVYAASSADIELGRDMYRERLEILKRCRETNEWPGIGNGRVEPLEMPSWWRRKQTGGMYE